jgi:hypothetical protein
MLTENNGISLGPSAPSLVRALEPPSYEVAADKLKKLQEEDSPLSANTQLNERAGTELRGLRVSPPLQEESKRSDQKNKLVINELRRVVSSLDYLLEELDLHKNGSARRSGSLFPDHGKKIAEIVGRVELTIKEFNNRMKKGGKPFLLNDNLLSYLLIECKFEKTDTQELSVDVFKVELEGVIEQSIIRVNRVRNESIRIGRQLTSNGREEFSFPSPREVHQRRIGKCTIM